MTQRGPRTLRGEPADVAYLAPNDPLYLCKRCLATWAVDALAAELARRGVDRETIEGYVSGARERTGSDPS